MDPNTQAPQPYNVPPQGMQPMYPSPTQGPLAPPPALPSMKARKPFGLIISLVVTVILLIGTLGFALMAFTSSQHYKNDSDAIVAKAVKKANEQSAAAKDIEFAEKEKSPFKTYLGPATYGAIGITYPKTWSAYVLEDGNGSTPVDGYMHPNVVPGIQSKTAFALRFQVLSASYTSESKRFDNMAKSGKVKVTPFKPAKVSGVLGIRVDGEIIAGQKDSMIVLPLRDKTIEISTQSADFLADFEKTILPNLTFTP